MASNRSYPMPRPPICWELWHTSATPFQGLDTPDSKGSRNPVSDWERGARGGVLMIDGEGVESIRRHELRNNQEVMSERETKKQALLTQGERDEKSDNDTLFLDENELSSFFKRHLLCKVAKEKQEAACAYLMTVLHQGGLLHPVSFSAFQALANTSYVAPGPAAEIYRSETGQVYVREDKTVPVPVSHERVVPMTRFTAFVTTADGFMVQEKTRQNVLCDRDGRITATPDTGKDFVYAAQATLNVRFTGRKQATISVQSATISYGNREVKKALDPRSAPRKWLERKLKITGNVRVPNYTARPPVHEEMQLARDLGDVYRKVGDTINEMKTVQELLKQKFTQTPDAAVASGSSRPSA